VLLAQLVLSLTLRNTIFDDEALYLLAGHHEIAHLLHGTALPENYASYFSGSPYVYPVIGAAIDGLLGLAGVRAVNLLLLLLTTVLLFQVTRRLAGNRAGLFAALVFAGSEPALFVGRLATYDALAIFLLAGATWIVVVGAESFRVRRLLLAAPILVLAAATKYAALLHVPTVLALAGLSSARASGWRRGLRDCALLTATTALLGKLLLIALPQLALGFRSSTSHARSGPTAPAMCSWQPLVTSASRWSWRSPAPSCSATAPESLTDEVSCSASSSPAPLRWPLSTKRISTPRFLCTSTWATDSSSPPLWQVSRWPGSGSLCAGTDPSQRPWSHCS
jgi:hypothetical protein